MKFGVISGGTSWPWLSYGGETCKGMLGGGVLGHPFTARHWPSPSSRAAWPRDAVFEKDAGNSFLGRRFLWGPRSSDFSGAETVRGGGPRTPLLFPDHRLTPPGTRLPLADARKAVRMLAAFHREADTAFHGCRAVSRQVRSVYLFLKSVVAW